MQGIWLYLIVDDARAAMAFYEKGFGAKKTFEALADDSKRVLNAQLEVFGTNLMVMDEFPEQSTYGLSPKNKDGTTFMAHVQCDDQAQVDSYFAKAEAAGATVTTRPQTMFWGDYWGQMTDPFGHLWTFGFTPKT